MGPCCAAQKDLSHMASWTFLPLLRRRQLADVGQVLSSGQKPAAKRPRAAAPAADASLSFGKLDIGTCEPR